MNATACTSGAALLLLLLPLAVLLAAAAPGAEARATVVRTTHFQNPTAVASQSRNALMIFRPPPEIGADSEFDALIDALADEVPEDEEWTFVVADPIPPIYTSNVRRPDGSVPRDAYQGLLTDRVGFGVWAAARANATETVVREHKPSQAEIMYRARTGAAAERAGTPLLDMRGVDIGSTPPPKLYATTLEEEKRQ